MKKRFYVITDRTGHLCGTCDSDTCICEKYKIYHIYDAKILKIVTWSLSTYPTNIKKAIEKYTKAQLKYLNICKKLDGKKLKRAQKNILKIQKEIDKQTKYLTQLGI